MVSGSTAISTELAITYCESEKIAGKGQNFSWKPWILVGGRQIEQLQLIPGGSVRKVGDCLVALLSLHLSSTGRLMRLLLVACGQRATHPCLLACLSPYRRGVYGEDAGFASRQRRRKLANPLLCFRSC